MQVLPWLPAAAILAGVVAGGVLWLLSRTLPRGTPRAPAARDSAFLLDGTRVVDAPADAAAAPGAETTAFRTWAELRDWLAPRFPGLPAELPPLAPSETLDIPALEPTDGGQVHVRRRGGRHLLTLREADPPSPARWHAALRALSDHRAFRAAAAAAPVAICICTPDGTVRWRSALFEAFDRTEADTILEAAGKAEGDAAHPVRIGPRDLEVSAVSADGLRVVYAEDITRLVQADTIRNSFIQTLTKTFADLATGLAVFDRTRRLVLFNPAVIDLTGLSAEFLSGRPALFDFFDQLRNRQVLPEPRSYASWRGQINHMIETASEGVYSEAWSLPSGLTYRVTGRPHPDGAVAFLIEDISDEVSLTRRSRGQIQMHQAVLDRLDDAVAVFRPDGVLAFCNAPFRDVLGFDPDSRLAETSFDDVIKAGCRRFPDAPAWAELAAQDGGAPRRRDMTLQQDTPNEPGRGRVSPLPDGYVMLSLTRLPAAEPA